MNLILFDFAAWLSWVFLTRLVFPARSRSYVLRSISRLSWPTLDEIRSNMARFLDDANAECFLANTNKDGMQFTSCAHVHKSVGDAVSKELWSLPLAND